MAINHRPLNSTQINSAYLLFGTGGGILITLEQEVQGYETTDNLLLITLEQEVISTLQNGNLITLVQFVKDATQKTFIERNGWYPILIIDGYRIPDDQIHGQLKVTRTENDSAQLTFTLIPPLGVQDVEAYEGKNVTLDVYRLDGNSRRVYTGVVNIPAIDLINKKLMFTCNDNRREQLNNQFAPFLPFVGYYTEEAFGKPTDIADELDKRLQTTPTSVDFDAYGFVTITPMLAKASADYTFNSDDVYRDDGRDPVIELTPRSRIVNTINIKATYQFQRLYHKSIGYIWDAPYRNDTCDFLNWGYSVPQRLMIKQAADAAGWPLDGDIEFTPVLASGFYNCNGATRAWSTSQISGSNVADTNADGTNKLDAAGNQVYKSVVSSINDVGSTLCFGASWTATKRWSQNITESYVMTVNAPQSAAQYGEISQDDTMGVQSEYDSSAWENYQEFRGIPNNVTTYPIAPAGSYWIDMDTNISGWYLTVGLALSKAQTTIIKAHRDNRARFYCPIDPRLDLVHTIQLNDTRFSCIGKVRQLTHTMDVTTGEAFTQCELAFSRSSGSATTDVNHIPPRPSFIPATLLDNTSTILDSHYGIDPAVNDPQNKWTGHIGNKYVTIQAGNTTNTYKTQFSESFVVDAPAVLEAVRSNTELVGGDSYELAIQNDPLTIIF